MTCGIVFQRGFLRHSGDKSGCMMSNRVRIFRPIRSSAGVHPSSCMRSCPITQREGANLSARIPSSSFIVFTDSLRVVRLARLHHLKLDSTARIGIDKFHLTSRSLSFPEGRSADCYPRLWPQVDHEWQTGNVGLEWSPIQRLSTSKILQFTLISHPLHGNATDQ